MLSVPEKLSGQPGSLFDLVKRIVLRSLQVRDDRLQIPVPDQLPCCPALGPVAPGDHERPVRGIAGETVPVGKFFKSVIERDTPPDRYRNPFLANAMVELNMIDTIGSGIKRMFRIQRDRNFPMPDYDLDEEGVVRVTIPGRLIDERYTRMLIERKDLTLMDVIALDKVQKGRPVTREERDVLREKKLIEGRSPNLYVSASVAAETDTRADYIRKRSFDRAHFKDMVVAYLQTYHEARWPEIEGLLLDKVSDALNEKQKREFIKSLLKEMRKEGTIVTVGKTRGAKWVLAPSPSEKV